MPLLSEVHFRIVLPSGPPASSPRQDQPPGAPSTGVSVVSVNLL